MREDFVIDIRDVVGDVVAREDFGLDGSPAWPGPNEPQGAGSGLLQDFFHLQELARELQILDSRPSGLEIFLQRVLHLGQPRAHIMVVRDQLPAPLAATLALELVPVLTAAQWQCSEPCTLSASGVALPPNYQQIPVAFGRTRPGFQHAVVSAMRPGEAGQPEQAVFVFNCPLDPDTPPRNIYLRCYMPDGPGAVERAGEALEEVLRLAEQRMPYRGHLLEFCASSLRLLDFLEEPQVTDEDFIIGEELRTQLFRHLIHPAIYREELRRLGVSPWRGVILEGPPGVGKTLAGRWIWGKLRPLGFTMLVTAVSGLQTRMGIERGILHLFEAARTLQPALVWLEDLDFIARDRDHWESGPLGALLQALDGVDSRGQVMIAATTNDPEILDAAISRRPGRFDARIAFSLPNADCRRRMLARFAATLLAEGRLEGLPENLVAETQGLTGAHLKELVAEATIAALAESGEQGSQAKVRTEHLAQALARLKAHRARIGFAPKEGVP